MPTLGQHYTREEIAAAHGGGTVEYLPNVNGQVVCACLKTDADYNPEAPRVILAGQGFERERAAKWLCEQGGPIPMYLKRAPNAWEFVGTFIVENFSTAPDVLAEYERQTGRQVTRAIFMVQA